MSSAAAKISQPNVEMVDSTFPKRFFSAMSELRAKKEFCDITLRCGSELIHAHKAVLSASSSFFKRMFQGEFSESKQEEIVLRHDTNYTVMSAIIDYMYSGVISISMENVVLLLSNLDYLQLEEAKEHFVKLLVSNLNVSNCIELFVQADLMSTASLEVLQEAALRCIVDNLHKISNSMKFKELTVDHIQKILPYVLNTKADTTYKAIMSWINQDFESRSTYFECLVKNISVEHLTRSELRRNILEKEFLKNSTFGCKWLVQTPLGNESPVLQGVLHIFDLCGEIFEYGFGRKALTRKSSGPALWSITKYKDEFYATDNQEFLKIEANTYQITSLQKSDAFRGCSLCAGYDQVYMIGGGWAYGSPLRRCSSYDCEQNQKVKIADMLNERDSPGVSFYNSAVYVFGGDCNIVERFDPREGYWCIAGEAPLREGWASATTLGNSIYCSGRYAVLQYDPRVERCTSIKVHKGTSLTSLDGRLYIGHDGGIAEYFPSTNTWGIVLEYNFQSPLALA